MELLLTSRLELQHSAALERMFYFHPEQGRFTDLILEQVDRSGSPQIAKLGDSVTLHLPLLPEAQTLFALNRTGSEELLMGVIIFIRHDGETIEALHIAVLPDLTHTANHGHSPVTQFLVKELCRIGSKIKGIEFLRLPYRRGIIGINAMK